MHTHVVPLDTPEQKGSTHTGSIPLQMILKDWGGGGKVVGDGTDSGACDPA